MTVDISVWQIVITAIFGPALILGIKEYFDYLKRKQERWVSIDRLIVERKLHLAEQAINVWKAQQVSVSMLTELIERAYDDILLFQGKEFRELIDKYSKDLGEIGKKSTEVYNAIELYFDITVTSTTVDPYKALSEYFTRIQKSGTEIKALSSMLEHTEDPIEVQQISNDINVKIGEIRKELKNISSLMREAIVQLNQSIEIVKDAVNQQYLKGNR